MAHTDAGVAELDELTFIRAQRGEEPACRALVERYQRSVFGLLGRMLAPRGRQPLVEDLAQETFLRVFRALADFDRAGPARLSTWILTIATRLALDELRRRTADVVPIDAAPEPSAPPEADRRELALTLGRALAALSADHRAVVLLHDVHGFAYEEIARAVGIDVGTVKSRLSRARSALRAALAEVKHE